MPFPYISGLCKQTSLFVFFPFSFCSHPFSQDGNSLIVLLETVITLPHLLLSFSLLCFCFLLNTDYCLILHSVYFLTWEFFFQPQQVHPSLGNLVVSHSQEVTMLMPNLAQTPSWPNIPQPRTYELTEPSCSASWGAGTTGTHHCTWQGLSFSMLFSQLLEHCLVCMCWVTEWQNSINTIYWVCLMCQLLFLLSNLYDDLTRCIILQAFCK